MVGQIQCLIYSHPDSRFLSNFVVESLMFWFLEKSGLYVDCVKKLNIVKRSLFRTQKVLKYILIILKT